MDNRNQNNRDQTNKSAFDDKIRDHKEAAKHLDLAVKHHLSAAKHYEEGHPELGIECENKAQECTRRANEIQSDQNQKPQINL